jgi:hypothetical protein
MKFVFAAALVATTVAGFASAADAAGGCGRGFHRGLYGRCVVNRGVVVVAPRVLARPGIVVLPRGRICPRGFSWRYGRCRPF